MRYRVEDAGYCWLDIAQLKPFRAPFLGVLRGLRRLGVDLFRNANYRMVYRLGDGDGEIGRYLAPPGE